MENRFLARSAFSVPSKHACAEPIMYRYCLISEDCIVSALYPISIPYVFAHRDLTEAILE